MNKPEFVVYRVRVCPFTRHGTGAPVVDKCVAAPNTPYAQGQLQERYEKLYKGLKVSTEPVEFEDETAPAPVPPPPPKPPAPIGYVLRLATAPEGGEEIAQLTRIQELLNKLQEERRVLRKLVVTRLEAKYEGTGVVSELKFSETCREATFDLRIVRGFLREVTDEKVLGVPKESENF